ncbi:MAG: hypothetical protein K6T83_09600 [Alicyclobacillus sp.]|nr:hypothetical protein [Alicyclobacillus sp.]
MYFFTSITCNYIPKARVLAKSLKRHCGDAKFCLVICDDLPGGFNLYAEPFDLILNIEDLGLPVSSRNGWIFEHTVVELCTAVKGQAFLRLFELGDAEKIVYLDPDIVVFDGLEELSNILDRHSVVLTPHQDEPEESLESIMDNEISSLKYGVFNLGFLAIRRSTEGVRFARWWRDRLLHFCYDDIPGGLFTDQRWMDLAPALFDDVYVLRDKSYNVATWNLTHRIVSGNLEDGLFVNGIPLKFYHFSGFDSGAQKTMLDKYGFRSPVLYELRNWYIRQLEAEGQGHFGLRPSKYEFYSNGERITDEERRVYRSRLDVMKAFPDPFLVTDNKICYYHWFRNEFKNSDQGRRAAAEQMELAAVKAQVDALLNSTSWKITEPLRKLKAVLTGK